MQSWGPQCLYEMITFMIKMVFYNRRRKPRTGSKAGYKWHGLYQLLSDTNNKRCEDDKIYIIKYNFLYLLVFSKTPFIFPHRLSVACCIRTMWIRALVLLTRCSTQMSVCGAGRAPCHAVDTPEQCVWTPAYDRVVQCAGFKDCQHGNGGTPSL